MKTFLGVPIVIRGEAWGNLYLAEKLNGVEFDDVDEQAAVVLASWAAIAVGAGGNVRDRASGWG